MVVPYRNPVWLSARPVRRRRRLGQDLGRTDYFINLEDDVDAEFPTGAAPTAQPLPADFIEWMMRDDTAVMVPKELNTPPGWPYEADPDLSGLHDLALIWGLKPRGRAAL